MVRAVNEEKVAHTCSKVRRRFAILAEGGGRCDRLGQGAAEVAGPRPPWAVGPREGTMLGPCNEAARPRHGACTPETQTSTAALSRSFCLLPHIGGPEKATVNLIATSAVPRRRSYHDVRAERPGGAARADSSARPHIRHLPGVNLVDRGRRRHGCGRLRCVCSASNGLASEPFRRRTRLGRRTG